VIGPALFSENSSEALEEIIAPNSHAERAFERLMEWQTEPEFRDLFRAVCVQAVAVRSEGVPEEPDRRVRLDLYDPSTFHHSGQCEHRSTADPTLLRAILKVRDGAGGGYWWVECGACDTGWQVPHYADSVG
jgi:hypothetical protein